MLFVNIYYYILFYQYLLVANIFAAETTVAPLDLYTSMIRNDSPRNVPRVTGIAHIHLRRPR